MNKSVATKEWRRGVSRHEALPGGFQVLGWIMLSNFPRGVYYLGTARTPPMSALGACAVSRFPLSFPAKDQTLTADNQKTSPPLRAAGWVSLAGRP